MGIEIAEATEVETVSIPGRTIRKRGERFPAHEINPFALTLDIPTRNKPKYYRHGSMSATFTDNVTGEVLSEGQATFCKTTPVDNEQFVKLFVNGVKALAELTPSGTKVFEILYHIMQGEMNKDRIYLSYKSAGKNIKISEKTYRTGLAELVDKHFIAAADDINWFWVNPDFIWNGDRVVFVQAHIRKNSAAHSRYQRQLAEEAFRRQNPMLPFSANTAESTEGDLQ